MPSARLRFVNHKSHTRRDLRERVDDFASRVAARQFLFWRRRRRSPATALLAFRPPAFCFRRRLQPAEKSRRPSDDQDRRAHPAGARRPRNKSAPPRRVQQTYQPAPADGAGRSRSLPPSEAPVHSPIVVPPKSKQFKAPVSACRSGLCRRVAAGAKPRLRLSLRRSPPPVMAQGAAPEPSAACSACCAAAIRGRRWRKFNRHKSSNCKCSRLACRRRADADRAGLCHAGELGGLRGLCRIHARRRCRPRMSRPPRQRSRAPRAVSRSAAPSRPRAPATARHAANCAAFSPRRRNAADVIVAAHLRRRKTRTDPRAICLFRCRCYFLNGTTVWRCSPRP